jgi:hypothetical protein
MNTNQSTGTISIVNTVGTDMCRYLLTKGRYVLPYCQQVPIWVGIYETPACPKGRYHLPYCQQVPIWVGIYETPACPKRRYHLVNRYRYEGKFMNTIQSRLFKRDDIGGIIEYICIASFATVSTSTEDVRITGTVFGKRRIEQNRPAYGTMTRVFWPLVFFYQSTSPGPLIHCLKPRCWIWLRIHEDVLPVLRIRNVLSWIRLWEFFYLGSYVLSKQGAEKMTFSCCLNLCEYYRFSVGLFVHKGFLTDFPAKGTQGLSNIRPKVRRCHFGTTVSLTPWTLVLWCNWLHCTRLA